MRRQQVPTERSAVVLAIYSASLHRPERYAWLGINAAITARSHRYMHYVTPPRGRRGNSGGCLPAPNRSFAYMPRAHVLFIGHCFQAPHAQFAERKSRQRPRCLRHETAAAARAAKPEAELAFRYRPVEAMQ